MKFSSAHTKSDTIYNVIVI